MWDFSTDPDFQAQLDWMSAFVRDQVEPLDLVYGDAAYRPLTADLHRLVDPLKDEVRRRRLWACHLDPELGGEGYGQLKLALMNEILGRSTWAPIVFGTQAPDTGNAEIIAHYGTERQKKEYLRPLLDGEIFSSFSMTEQHAGSDPKMFTTQARRGDDGSWLLDGEKFFTSNLRSATFAIVMAVTDPAAEPYRRMSMFLVPTDMPGIEVLRDIGTMDEPLGTGMHAYVRYHDVRLPDDALLGGEGDAFVIAQTRLGGGRIHHAMRSIGQCTRAFDMMCERVLSRQTQGSPLADKESIQSDIADSYLQIEQLRLFVLYTAWLIDQNDARVARKQISAAKVLAAQVLHDVVERAVHVHGALGVSNEMPLGRLWMSVPMMGIMDGPSEVHRVTVARQVLKDYQPAAGDWPSEHLPGKLAAAEDKLAARLEAEG
jgi:acyl-CoA dehydrogenase